MEKIAHSNNFMIGGLTMFCNHCGTQLPDHSAFCNACGQPVGGIAPTADNTHTLTITRESQVYLINPPIQITIDGTIRLSIDNGHIETVQLDEGAHQIEFVCSIRSKKIAVTMNEDKLVTIKFSRMTGAIVATVS